MVKALFLAIFDDILAKFGDNLAKFPLKIWRALPFEVINLIQQHQGHVNIYSCEGTSEGAATACDVALIAVAQFYNSLHDCTYLLKSAVLLPHLAPWHQLMDYADASSFLHMTGLTREAFILLLDIVQPPGHQAHGIKRGRRCSLPPDAQLGLLLFCLGSTMGIKHLCLLFGVMPSVHSQILNVMLKFLVKRLHNNPNTAIRFPSPEKCRILLP